MSGWLATGTPVYSKNIVTDYGAVADGVTDCTTAFTNFRTFARAQGTDLGVLLIPPGSYAFTIKPFSNIKNLIVNAYGATFPSVTLTANCGYLQTAASTARVQTVLTGEHEATLVTPADAANFSVGDWCALGALELQGGANGYPPNLHFNQFVQIVGISGGVVYFASGANDDYSSAYPETRELPLTAYDSGGPATLFRMGGANGDPADSFDTHVRVNGLTVVNTGGSPTQQVYFKGRHVELFECTFTACVPIPGTNKIFSATRCTATYTEIELDKDCEYVEFKDCSLTHILCQSSSVGQMVVDGCTFTTGIVGTPRRLLVKGATSATLACGVAGYGATEEIIIESPAVITSLSAGDGTYAAYTDFTQSGGNLRYTPGPLTFGIPGTTLALGTHTRMSAYGSSISSVTATSGDTVLHTSFPDPLPTLPVGWDSPSYVRQIPCEAITVESGVTGCPQILALAGGVTGEPLFSNLDYTSNWISAGTFDIRGQLVSITIDVLTAYTGGQATANLHVGGASDNQPVRLADGTAGTFGPIVNTKIVGTRVITPGSVTGAQSGDTLGSAPGLIWFTDFAGITPVLTGNFSGDTAPQKPSVRITIVLDQAP